MPIPTDERDVRNRKQRKEKKMQEMLNSIENAISKKYAEIKSQGKIITGIEDVFRQVGFRNPELALHIKKRMLELAREKGDLP